MPELVQSVCALDCPDCCAVLVEVENGRGVKMRGNPDHPITQGFLCPKVTRYLDRVYAGDRLLYPQRRVNGRLERVSWDQALDEIAARLRDIADEYGGEAVLPYSYGGTLGFLNGGGMDRRFFHRLGASRLDRTICASAGAAGLTATQGARLGVAPEDFALAKLILVWGANIHGANVHLWPFITEARRNGARLVVIDPVTTRTAALADQHLGIYPGSDLALALSMAHVIFRDGLADDAFIAENTTGVESLRELAREYTPERAAALTGLTAAEIEALAREYAASSPAVIRVNYGVQRSERGGSAVRAIAMLPAITGAWKQRGGGLQLTTSGAFEVDRAALERPDLEPAPTRMVNMSTLGEALTELDDPPVKALVVYNSNPAAVAPNQTRVLAGLQRKDLFKVVLEQFETDTAAYTDYILPVTTFLEHTDLYFAYGHYYIQMAKPALPAPGETKSNVEIFRLLAQRMGFHDACFTETEEQMIRAALASGSPFLEGVTYERLERERFVRLNVDHRPVPHAGAKINLDARGLAYTPPVESRLGDARLRASYPLELISSKCDDGMNSTFSNRPEVDKQTARLWMHAGDAAGRGIEDGDTVRVFNARGEVEMTALVNGGVRRGVVRAPSVRANRRSPGGRGINVLTSSRLTDLGGGATFFSCLVQVEKCGNSSAVEF